MIDGEKQKKKKKKKKNPSELIQKQCEFTAAGFRAPYEHLGSEFRGKLFTGSRAESTSRLKNGLIYRTLEMNEGADCPPLSEERLPDRIKSLKLTRSHIAIYRFESMK